MTLALPVQSTHPDRYYGKYVAGMFASGEQGGWYDPSDLSTLFQDAAGTIPVTGVEQPVGRILDKSGRGNHATQTTTASRPTLSARYNLFNFTEQFDNSYWGRYGVTVTPNFALNPFGVMNADLVIDSVSGGEHLPAGFNFPVVSGLSYKISFYFKKHSTSSGILDFGLSGPIYNWDGAANVNLNTGSISGGGTQVIARSITNVGDGWFLASIVSVAPATGTAVFRIRSRSASNQALYTGDGVSGFYIWGGDIRVANESANLPAYQRVNTATDYDTNGFPPYLRFDGVDDWLVTPSINFTGTDKMTVFAGVRKLSDAASGIVVELSSDVSVLPGSFQVAAPGAGGADKFRFISSGSTAASVGALTTSSVYSAPSTQIICGIADIAADIQRLRLNWQIINANSSDQGSGSFGNYPLYVGTRGVVNLPFNGRLYGLIVRGAQTDDLHLTNTERYLAYKTGVAL